MRELIALANSIALLLTREGKSNTACSIESKMLPFKHRITEQKEASKFWSDPLDTFRRMQTAWLLSDADLEVGEGGEKQLGEAKQGQYLLLSPSSQSPFEILLRGS